MWVTDLVLQFDCHDSQPTLGILHAVRYTQSQTTYIDDLTKFTDKISSQSNGELANSSNYPVQYLQHKSLSLPFPACFLHQQFCPMRLLRQAYCHLAVFYLDFNFTKFMKFMVSLTFKLAVCIASDDHKHHCLSSLTVVLLRLSSLTACQCDLIRSYLVLYNEIIVKQSLFCGHIMINPQRR